MTEKKLKNTTNSPKKKSLSDLLIQNGFAPSLTDDDMKFTDEKFGSTDIILPPEVDYPDFIFQRANKKIDPTPADIKKINGKLNDYFKKLVLAAEIVNQLWEEPTFGHKKFVKVYFVCEEICKIRLSTNYLQYAAGPLDPKHLHTIDAEFKKRKWFTVTKRKNGYGFEYAPDVNVLDYQLYYMRYFKNQIETINRIIELFRKKSSDFCEIVATLLASWLNLLENDISVNAEILFKEFYAWSNEKMRFKRSQLIHALEWMKTNDIVPIIS